MNKKELVAALAEKSQGTKKEAEVAVNALMEIIVETVTNGDKVQLIGFGTFEPRNRAARMVTNPQTHEAFLAPEAVVPVFKAGQSFRTSVAEAAAKRAAAAAAAAKKSSKKK